MVSIEKCREILEELGNKFTDEEIVYLRDWLVEMAKNELDYLMRNKDFKITTNFGFRN